MANTSRRLLRSFFNSAGKVNYKRLLYVASLAGQVGINLWVGAQVGEADSWKAFVAFFTLSLVLQILVITCFAVHVWRHQVARRKPSWKWGRTSSGREKQPPSEEKIKLVLENLQKSEIESIEGNEGIEISSLSWRYDFDRQTMSEWDVFDDIAQEFNKRYAVYGGEWYRVLDWRLYVLGHSLTFVTFGAAVLSTASLEDSNSLRRLIADYLNNVSLTFISLLSVLAFTGVGSIREVRKEGASILRLSEEESRRISLLAANTDFIIQGLDSGKASYAHQPERGMTKGFISVPAWAIWRPLKVKGDGALHREDSDGDLVTRRNFFVRGVSDENSV